ncbi:MAG: D-glycero-beta-D-manno-heptose 1-phosphate adenylyltransferase [Ignavibacteriae bacterium HGW-Ignavibacteriae-1]|jgi:D-beta-D-heptose 7-phosphate kinase/D-beta-D-heptose 1-phosphate adenosyltransferase|nr:MAG: D-glycero-beta-D-manno-heptose 1-phosphate adenylyltransferase [Ignavibacteriae bacterium HGW-Ignavibacteriae-1]
MLYESEDLAKILQEKSEQGKKIVFTNGCFDILHAGHVKYLEQSKKLGDVLVIGLNSDDSVRRLKGDSRPVNNQMDRAIVLSALRAVDYVCFFDEDTPLELIMQLKPDIITKGGDYTVTDVVGGEFVINNGGEVVIIELVEGKSTTSTIQRLNATKQ